MKIRVLLLSLLPMLVLSAFSSPVKSDEAAKSIVFSDDTPSPNPYVTSGLVAMWDAEWNVGFNDHDPNSLVWVNLGNGGDIFNALVSNGGFTEDGFVGSAAALRPMNTACTISVVFAHLQGNNYYPINAYDSTGGYRIWEFYGNSSYRIRWWVGRGDGAVWQTSFIPVETSRFQTYDLVIFADGLKVVYYNGIRMQTSGSQTGYSDGTREDISIGSPNCAILRASIYNRPLDGAEIEYNYSIDRLRFNLP